MVVAIVLCDIIAQTRPCPMMFVAMCGSETWVMGENISAGYGIGIWRVGTMATTSGFCSSCLSPHVVSTCENLYCLSPNNCNWISGQNWATLSLYLSFLLFQTLTHFSTEQQSTIELSHLPDPLFFLSSDPIQLTCRYNPSQYTFRHWIHPSGTLISSTSERFTLRSQQRSTILTIARAVENDQGTYSCVFRNSQGGSVSQSIVGHFRQAVTIAAPPPEYNVTVGNSATLSCDAQHQNRIQWQNSNRNAISSSSDGRVQIQGTNLFFREVRLGDNGTYYCLASNEVSNDEITSHLVVLGEYKTMDKWYLVGRGMSSSACR